MTDIQKARDVLAKWREAANQGDPDAWVADTNDAHLIVGTAGNPELLDAIDYLLEAATIHESRSNWSGAIPHAERIAAAILAADERMNS